MSFRDIYRRFKERMESGDVEVHQNTEEHALNHLDQMEDELKSYIREEVAKAVAALGGRASWPTPVAGIQRFHPETDAPQPGTVDLNALPPGQPTPAPAPLAAPAQPEVVADTPQEQAADAEAETPAIIEPDPGALPGSTGTVAESQPDGSTKVTEGLAPDNGATVPVSTIDPTQTPPPSVPTDASVQTEAAQPTDGEPLITAVDPEPVVEPAPEVVVPAADEPEAVEEPTPTPAVEPTAAPETAPL